MGHNNFMAKFFLFLILFLIPLSVFAAGATLSILPATGEFTVGQTVKTTIFVHSGGNAINAAEATLNFPSDLLRVASISKANSIFSLWAVEPSFDNAKGTISFAGGTTKPFIGSSGEALSVVFHVKKSGLASLALNGARTLLADGLGTDVFGSSQGASWKLMAAAPQPVIPATGLPLAPTIWSSTHPDENKWYSNKNPKFSWTLSPDVDAVKLLYDQFSDSQPTLLYSPPISERELGGVQDGIWYFHIQFRNGKGWGETAHFRVQIDTEPPEPFVIQFLDGKRTVKARPRINFASADKLSGIDRYEMKIDSGEWQEASYILPTQEPGEHLIILRAFDRAGNMTEAQDTFTVVRADLLYIFIRVAAGLAVVLALCLIYFIVRFKRKTIKKAQFMEKQLHKTFDYLRDAIEEYVKDKEASRQYRDELDSAEKALQKMIQRIINHS